MFLFLRKPTLLLFKASSEPGRSRSAVASRSRRGDISLILSGELVSVEPAAPLSQLSVLLVNKLVIYVVWITLIKINFNTQSRRISGSPHTVRLMTFLQLALLCRALYTFSLSLALSLSPPRQPGELYTTNSFLRLNIFIPSSESPVLWP
jgi:hypothetical protein